jgi:hypothetical protein
VVVEPVAQVPPPAAPAPAVSPPPVISPPPTDPEAAAREFVRFCYRRRSVAWPELYDEMCFVAARGDYRGMDYDQLERAGIRFALAALPGLADLVARVIAEEHSRQGHLSPQGGGLSPAGIVAA